MVSALRPPHDDPTESPAWTLGPLIAGAHVRGLFDAFEMVGQGAVFLDRSGRALAITRAATQTFGANLALVAGRPVCANPSDDAKLWRAILDSVAGESRDVEIGAAGAELALSLKPLGNDPRQLIAAILLIDPPRVRREKENVALFPAPGRLATKH